MLSYFEPLLKNRTINMQVISNEMHSNESKKSLKTCKNVIEEKFLVLCLVLYS